MEEPAHRAEQPAAVARPRGGRRRRNIPAGRKFLFILIIFAFLFVSLEFLSRVYWSIQGLSFFGCQREIQHVYYGNVPDFIPLMRPRGKDDGKIRVLMLGASTFYPNVTSISTILRERLTVELKRRVEIIDLAVPAHTTLDSYYKYLELGDYSFDLVLVYHGINELRANSCPPDMFREDYSHYLWYREVNAAEQGRASRIFALPVTLKIWLIRAGEGLHLFPVIPDDAGINPDWNKYGGDIKSAAPFAQNLERTIDLAQERNEKIVIMTFAHYLAPGYTLKKFENLELDYIGLWSAVEIWGTPDNVMKGLAAHNDEIKRIAAARGGQILFVDQDSLIPKEGKYFNDICHFSNAGSEQFVENLLPVIVPELRKSSSETGAQ